MPKRSGANPRTRRKPSPENPVTFYPAWCKKCGICVALCPKNVLEADSGGQPFAARPERCVRCHLCELRCPDFAISVADREEKEQE